MITVLAEVLVDNFQNFIAMFSSEGLAARRKHESLKSRVFQTADDPNRIFILFEWKNRENFENFLCDPQVRQTMKASGTTAPPKFIFLDKAAEFDG